MGGGWLSQQDISEAGQYDLMKLGFMSLEENTAGDLTDTPFEPWVPEVFGQVSRAAEQGHSNQYSLVPQFYRDVLDKMGQDSKISGEEIRQALTIRDPLVRDVVSRMVVKHHSEWFGGRSTGRWDGFYKTLGQLETGYCEKWQAELEWMSKVPPFNQDSAIWHMHPVVFLDAIKAEDQLITIEQFKLMLPSDSQSIIDAYLEPLNETMKLFDINTPLRKAHFMAQILHETGSFSTTEELASGADYEGRADLGNIHAGDGRLFKGRGLLQITGRGNYTKCQRYLRGKLRDELLDITSSTFKAQQLSNNPRYATLSSGYFWKYIKPKLNGAADKDDIYWVSVYINGWSVQKHPYYPGKEKEPNHMGDRINKLSIAKKAFGVN